MYYYLVGFSLMFIDFISTSVLVVFSSIGSETTSLVYNKVFDGLYKVKISQEHISSLMPTGYLTHWIMAHNPDIRIA